MIERARTFEVRRIILATNPRSLRDMVLPSGEIYEHANARYSEIVREVAVETGVELVDVRQGFEPVSDEELVELLLGPPDLLHLSEAGNLFYTDLVWPAISRAASALLDALESAVA
jgi:hypothetical protein